MSFPIMWNYFSDVDIESNSSLDLNSSMIYTGSVSKIHVFLDLDVYSSSSRSINLKDSCSGIRDEKLKCYKDMRDKNIEQIRIKLNSIQLSDS